MFDIRKNHEHAIYEAVLKTSDIETAKDIVFEKDGLAKNENNADWVKSTMYRLESKFDQATIKQIRMDCQCGYGMDEKLSFVKELVSSVSNLSEFASSEKAKSAGLFYSDGVLYLKFSFCPCPMLADVDRLDSNTWCQCTTGYSKVLFENAFECKVNVELLKSIKMGDDICLMQIIPNGVKWKRIRNAK